MVDFFKRYLPNKILKLAVLLIIILAASDLVAGLELIVFANVIGLDFFVLIYLSGLIIYINSFQNTLTTFWQKYFSISTRSSFKEDVFWYGLQLFHCRRQILFLLLIMTGFFIAAYGVDEVLNINWMR